MNEDLQLGYLVIDSTDPDSWRPYLLDTLGLMPAATENRYRMDRWQQRFEIRRAERDDLGVIGLVSLTPAAHARLVDRVHNAGLGVVPGTAADCEERGVAELVRVEAPGGVAVELAHTPIVTQQPFASPVVPAGFLTGRQGLGHAVMMVDDLDKARAFWLDVLGFKLSDGSQHETPSGESRAMFLHCNGRHHSIAIVQRPERSTYPKTLLHFMIEAKEMDAVGMAFDRALDANLPIPRSLGRHPNDRMFSFYMRTPGGFDCEFGWGAVQVDDNWSVAQYDHISAWGHRNLT